MGGVYRSNLISMANISTVTNNRMIFALISGGDVHVHLMIEPNHRIRERNIESPRDLNFWFSRSGLLLRDERSSGRLAELEYISLC